MKKTTLIFTMLVFILGENYAQTVTDYDGNIYNTVTIGTQVWLVENLKVTHYNNGDPIPNVINSSSWINLKTGAYCDYNHEPINSSTYGRLYNWYAVTDNRTIAPIGWHVPSDKEWQILIVYLGGDSIAGGKLKEIGLTHWNSPNTGATNESGFTALPGGFRVMGNFNGIGNNGTWWSSTDSTSYSAFYQRIYYDYGITSRRYGGNASGYSVRCLQDSTTSINELHNQEQIIVYPNPTLNKIYINCVVIQELKMQLYNILGQCIVQKDLKNITNEIDISSLTKGIYIMKLTTSKEIIKKKIIKE